MKKTVLLLTSLFIFFGVLPFANASSNFVSKINTIFQSEKSKIYKPYACQDNIHKAIKKIKDQYKNNSLLESNLRVVNFSNNGNGAISYGNYTGFTFHVLLTIWDEMDKQWKVLDYDIDKIAGKSVNDPIPLIDYMKKAFGNDSIKWRIEEALKRRNFYVLKDIPQVKIFKLSEYQKLKSADIDCFSKSLTFGKIDCSPEVQASLSGVKSNNLIELMDVLKSRTANLDSIRKVSSKSSLKRLVRSKKTFIKLYNFLFR